MLASYVTNVVRKNSFFSRIFHIFTPFSFRKKVDQISFFSINYYIILSTRNKILKQEVLSSSFLALFWVGFWSKGQAGVNTGGGAMGVLPPIDFYILPFLPNLYTVCFPKTVKNKITLVPPLLLALCSPLMPGYI